MPHCQNPRKLGNVTTTKRLHSGLFKMLEYCKSLPEWSAVVVAKQADFFVTVKLFLATVFFASNLKPVRAGHSNDRCLALTAHIRLTWKRSCVSDEKKSSLATRPARTTTSTRLAPDVPSVENPSAMEKKCFCRSVHFSQTKKNELRC